MGGRVKTIIDSIDHKVEAHLQVIPLSIYIATLFIALIGFCIWWVLYKWSSAETTGHRVCRECGYQLNGEGPKRCPECGLENAAQTTVTHMNSGRRVVGYIADLVLVAVLVFATYVFSAGVINKFVPKTWRVLYYGAVTGGSEGGLLLQMSGSSEPISENDQAYLSFMTDMVAMPVDMHLWAGNDNHEFRLHLGRATPHDAWNIIDITSDSSDVDIGNVVTPMSLSELIKDQSAIEVQFDSKSMLNAFEAIMQSEWREGEFQSSQMEYPNRGRSLASGLYPSRPYISYSSSQDASTNRQFLTALIVLLILGVLAVSILWYRRYHTKKN